MLLVVETELLRICRKPSVQSRLRYGSRAFAAASHTRLQRLWISIFIVSCISQDFSRISLFSAALRQLNAPVSTFWHTGGSVLYLRTVGS